MTAELPHILLGREKNIRQPVSRRKEAFPRKLFRWTKWLFFMTFRGMWLFFEQGEKKCFPQYIPFGIFALCNYVVPFFMGSYPVAKKAWQIALTMRFGAALTCIIIMTRDYWPKPMMRYFHIVWHLGLMYCFPFMTFWLVQDNGFSAYWCVNMVFALILLGILVDLIRYLVLAPVGFILAWKLHAVVFGPTTMDKLEFHGENMFVAVYSWIFASMIGVYFSRLKERTLHEKMVVHQDLAKVMSWEFQPSLTAIRMGMGRLKQLIPGLAPKPAPAIPLRKADRRPEEPENQILTPETLAAVRQTLESMDHNSQKSDIFLEMYLVRTRNENAPVPLKPLSMRDMVEEALATYPFDPKRDQIPVLLDEPMEDFEFLGDPILIRHILYNLLSNSLHQIRTTGHGQITLWMQCDYELNQLHFRDTSTGIPSLSQGFLFDRFYTRRNEGAGLGLGLYFSHWAMKAMRGFLSCRSSEKEYTDFILYIPPLKLTQTATSLPSTKPLTQLEEPVLTD